MTDAERLINAAESAMCQGKTRAAIEELVREADARLLEAEDEERINRAFDDLTEELEVYDEEVARAIETDAPPGAADALRSAADRTSEAAKVLGKEIPETHERHESIRRSIAALRSRIAKLRQELD